MALHSAPGCPASADRQATHSDWEGSLPPDHCVFPRPATSGTQAFSIGQVRQMAASPVAVHFALVAKRIADGYTPFLRHWRYNCGHVCRPERQPDRASPSSRARPGVITRRLGGLARAGFNEKHHAGRPECTLDRHPARHRGQRSLCPVAGLTCHMHGGDAPLTCAAQPAC